MEEHDCWNEFYERDLFSFHHDLPWEQKCSCGKTYEITYDEVWEEGMEDELQIWGLEEVK